MDTSEGDDKTEFPHVVLSTSTDINCTVNQLTNVTVENNYASVLKKALVNVVEVNQTIEERVDIQLELSVNSISLAEPQLEIGTSSANAVENESPAYVSPPPVDNNCADNQPTNTELKHDYVSMIEVADEDDLESVKILAWDYSYSTHGTEYYHKIGEKYLNDFSRKYETSSTSDNKPIYLTWSTSCSLVTLQELQEINQQRKGDDGTYPTALISWIMCTIPKEKSVELWLITDGEIGTEELQSCALLNRDINYSRVNFIAINEQRENINMSVGASFFHEVKLRIFYNDTLFKQINTSQPFDYDSITCENIDTKWDTLSDFIQAKFMGTDVESLEEVEKLSAVRRRLLQSIDGDTNKNYDFSSKKRSDLLDALKSCQFYKNLLKVEVRNLRETIDAGISRLIDYIHNKHRSYEFETIKLDFKRKKMRLIDEQSEPKLRNLDDLEKCTIFDAVSLENEENVPVLLITVTDVMKKYWIEGNFTKYRAVMDCPLLANVDNCIGHVYSYETFKSLCASGTGTIMNPMTNQPVFGGLIFDKSADKWNDYVLAMSFFNGKKVNTCLALWYYVIWKNAKNSPWVESAVVDMIRAYAFRRIRNTRTKLAFGRLPLDPNEFVPIHVACYYCTEGSSLLFGEDSTLFGEERLRQYWSVAESMLDILEYFEYGEVDKEFVMKRAKVFENMTQLKRIPQEMEKRYFLLQNMFESKGRFLTHIIKDRKAIGFVNLLQYHHNTSMIPFNFDESPSPADITSWLLVSYDKSTPETANLCLNTCRPYFVVNADANGVVPNYSQLFNEIMEITLDHSGEILCKSAVTKLDQSKLISGFKLYIDLTTRLKRFPTLEEYSTYTWKTKKFYGSKVRLFNTQIMSNIEEVFDLFAKLGVGVDEFIEKTKSSVNILKRIEMEHGSLPNIAREEFINTAKDMLVTAQLPTVAQQIAELKLQNKGKQVQRNPKRKSRKKEKPKYKKYSRKKRRAGPNAENRLSYFRRRHTRNLRSASRHYSSDEDFFWSRNEDTADKTKASTKIKHNSRMPDVEYTADKSRCSKKRMDEQKARKRVKSLSKNTKQKTPTTENLPNSQRKANGQYRRKSGKSGVTCQFFNDDDFCLPIPDTNVPENTED